MVLTAEGRGVSLQLLDWYSRRRETTTQHGPGPNKRWPLRIKTARHALWSLFRSRVVEGSQADQPCIAHREDMGDLRATGQQEVAMAGGKLTEAEAVRKTGLG